MKNRIIIFLILLVTVFIIMACANKSDEYKQNEENLNEENLYLTLDEELEAENIVEGSSSVSDKISNQELTVKYEGSKFEKSVFAVGEEMLYICGLNQEGACFLGGMKKEDNIFQEFTIEIPNGIRVFNMSIDTNDKCHMLWMSVEKVEINNQILDRINFEESYIKIINRDGEIEKTIDVTEIFMQEQIRPFCFVVNEAGNYFFEKEEEILMISSEGKLEARFIGQGTIEGIGCSSAGNIYYIYSDENNDKWIGSMIQNELVSCDVMLPESDAKYTYLSAGTDTELLIYNKENGVYSYDKDTNSIEYRVNGRNLPVSGEFVGGYGILGDGRLCLLSQKEGQTVFYYIPVGK